MSVEALTASPGRLGVRSEDGMSARVFLGAMAAANLPQDDAPTNFAFSSIVGRRNRRVVEEGQQGVLVLVDVLGQLEVLLVAEVPGHQGAHRLAHLGDGHFVERLGKRLSCLAEDNRVLKCALKLSRKPRSTALGDGGQLAAAADCAFRPIVSNRSEAS